MTLPIDKFNSYTISDANDKYFNIVPSLKLDDLPDKYKGEIQCTIMLSTYNRQAQLQRTLETIARQTFRPLEVLLADDGSTQDIKAIVNKFSDFINISYFFIPRETWTSCPSRAYKHMLPSAKGKSIIISHPEMLIDYGGIELLHKSIMGDDSVESLADKYIIDEYQNGSPIGEFTKLRSKYYWGNLRPGFIAEEYSDQIDNVDWHSNLKNLQTIPNFGNMGGFAGMKNSEITSKSLFPWWFCGGTTKDNPIWDNMPVFKGHGIIDMWLCRFRSINKIVDVVSKDLMCYHQAHVTSAIAPEGENLDESKYAQKVDM